MDIQNNTTNKTAIHSEQQYIIDILSNIEKHLSSISYSLDYFVFNDKRDVNKSHLIPD